MVPSSKLCGRIAGLVVLVLGFVASCAQLMGDVELDPPGSNCQTTVVNGLGSRVCRELPDAGPGDPPKPVICEQGLTRCDGRLLQFCTDGGTAWATLQACASAALCEASDLATVASCKAPSCSTEQMSCEGNVLRLCNEDRTGWEEFAVCETAAHCDAGQRQCLPAPCETGDRRCNLGKLERCNDSQTDWEQLDQCVTNELCEQTIQGAEPGGFGGGVADGPLPMLDMDAEGPTSCLLPKCLPNQVQCDLERPNQLLACVEGQTGFALAEECITPALCEASITYTGLRGYPRCKSPACDVGEHRCSGRVLEICNDNRDGFRPIEECTGPPFCNAVAADNGGQGCEEAPCDPGEERCNGAQRERCRDDQTDFDPIGEACDTRDLCVDDDPFNSLCRPPVCQRGPLSGTEFRCQGAVLQRCNDQHTAYDTLNTCATAALCSAGLGFNGCQPPVCAPGQTRCTGDFLQVCNLDRTGFVSVERCAAGTCDSIAGRCADPCIVGSARCNSQGQLEECRDRLIGREITARCLSPQLCDATARSCRQPPAGCTADGVRVCVPQGNGSTLLQVCAGGRSRFDTLDTCTGSERCDPNNALCDVCDQNGQATCQGTQLVRCAVDGQSTIPSTCSNGCQAVANGPDRCRNCVPGSASCQNSDLVVCVNRGANDEFLERQACGTAQRCTTELAACTAGQPCQCEFCDAQDVGCDGRFPTRCNAAQTAFERVPNVDCVTADNCNPRTGACFPCNVGDVACQGSILQGCRLDRSGFERVPGATAGGIRCTSDNGGTFSQQCSGTNLTERECPTGLCDPNVPGGCAECVPTGFVSECTDTGDGRPGRTQCVGGVEQVTACAGANNSCQAAACTGAGQCVFRSLERGTECSRGGGQAGFCDGLQSNPSCVECVDDDTCDDGNSCTTDRCGANGACVHDPASGTCTRPGGQAGVCSAGSCVQACTPGQGSCDGRTFTRCNAAGTGFDPPQQCASAALCSPAGCGAPCDPDDCGDVGCNANQTDCNICSAALCTGQVALGACQEPACDGLSCVARSFCAANQNCNAASNTCVARICTPNATDCTTDGVFRRCNADGSAFVTQQQCASAGLCSPASGCGAPCDPDDCGDAGCNAAQTGCNACNAATTCGNLPLGPCQRAVCGGPGGLTCQAQSIACPNGQVCNPANNQCERVASCDDGIVDPGEACQPGDAALPCPGNQIGSIACVNCQRVNNCSAPMPACGDGVVNGNEQCEGDQVRDCPGPEIGTQTCQGCQFVGACEAPPPQPFCGDGVVNGNEQCEGAVVRACPEGQTGAETCVACQFVSACVADPGSAGPGNGGPGNGGPGNGGPGNGGPGNGGPGNGGPGGGGDDDDDDQDD